MANTVRELFIDYMEYSGKSQNVVARAAGISPTTLSLWLNGKYEDKSKSLLKRLEAFLTREYSRQTYSVDEHFVDTEISKEIMDVLNYCHTHNDMGVVYGTPGLGKTVTAVEYATKHPDTIMITAFKGFSRGVIISSIAQDLELMTRMSIYQQFQMSVKALQGSDRLLIIDEAQFLTNDSLEIVRSIHDQAGVGVVYLGQPSLSRKMMGKEAEFFAQLYSRLGVKLTLADPEFEDIKLVAKSYGITNTDIHKFLWDHVINDKWGGSFRKMSKLLKLAIRTSSARKEDITIPFLKDVGRFMIYND
ncbi:MAG: AAA family ATPase [Candidatus Marinimicrobia bacterium]|nr:AAA family ATPase [Candidatus Neomarinimicrobiota bacterium]